MLYITYKSFPLNLTLNCCITQGKTTLIDLLLQEILLKFVCQTRVYSVFQGLIWILPNDKLGSKGF